MAFRNLEGTTLGQYELVEFLGKGGMGVVYRAIQPRLNRSVAVKILSDSQATRPEQVKRFVREAEISAKLEHPHIVPIYDYGNENNMNYVVMRLLSGGSLADHIENVIAGHENRLTLQEAGALLQQIASALDYAHVQNIIHRDVKPSNVMFDDYRHAFLVDFGLVKLLDTSQSNLTGAGIILGTPAYMAPEQWRDEPLTAAIDQYALANMAYLMLAGRLPFNADTSPYELMQQHCEAIPPDIHELQRDIPPKVSAVLQRALAKNPEDRYQYAMDFAEAFIEASQYRFETNIQPGIFGDHQTTAAPGTVAKPYGILVVEQSRDPEMIGIEARVDKEVFTIGRLNRDLNFNGDRNVSRNHVHITQDELGEFYLVDQDSTLHTVVDGVRVQPFVPCQLGNNADIRLGTTTIMNFTIHY